MFFDNKKFFVGKLYPYEVLRTRIHTNIGLNKFSADYNKRKKLTSFIKKEDNIKIIYTDSLFKKN